MDGKIGVRLLLALTFMFPASVAAGQECRLDSVISRVESSVPGADIDSMSLFILNGIVYGYEEVECALAKERSAGKLISSIAFMHRGKDYGTIRTPQNVVLITTTERGNRKTRRAFKWLDTTDPTTESK
ncbi:MAG: hypothetical protein LUD76_10475 [Alistipes sp.]|nr:hypothetical protein [Alistipes sp.]